MPTINTRPKRSCNRHADCDKAEAEFKKLYPNGKEVGYTYKHVIYKPDHCHDECCEECFGS